MPSVKKSGNTFTQQENPKCSLSQLFIVQYSGHTDTLPRRNCTANVEKVLNPKYQAIKQQARQWAAFKNWELEVK